MSRGAMGTRCYRGVVHAVLQTRFTRARSGLRRTLSRIGRRAYLTLALASTLILAVPVWTAEIPLGIGALAFLAFFGMWFAGLVAGTTITHLGVARLDGDTLLLETAGARFSLPAARLREGSVRAGYAGWSLRLRDDRGDEYDVAVPDEATAVQWLDVLGLDASRRAMRVVSDRTLAQWAFAYFFGGFFAMPFMFVALGLLMLLGVDPSSPHSLAIAYLGMGPGYWFATRAVGRVDVSVGADGVRAGRGFGRRFFPIASIAGADVAATTLYLRLANGGTERYRFDRADEAWAVSRRVLDALTLHRNTSPALPPALATDEPLTAAQWRDRFVHALRDEGYRAAAFTRDDLERLLRAKDVPAPQRLGAAMALSELAPAEGATGVRIAVEAMVDPALPRALEAEDPRSAATRSAAG